jgi:uncharacterized protein YbbK (DUF523 family)
MEKLLVSACTVGIPTKFNGSFLDIPSLKKLVDKGIAIPFCAEISAGFPVPRKPAEIESGKTALDVLKGEARIFETNNSDGTKGADVTEQFIQGANNTLKICQENQITIAILRENSPSCGSSLVYSGKFDGEKIPGMGVVSQLLRDNGITVYSQDNVPTHLIQKLLEES